MQLASCRYRNTDYPAIVRGEHLALMAPREGGVLTLATDTKEKPVFCVSPEEVEFLHPVPNPRKIICVGNNFRQHLKEGGAAEPTLPSVFIRFEDSLAGHKQPIRLPAISEQFDFEGELAVVIGRPTWRVQEREAMACVAGYACLAENSVRDFQFHSRQATAGKNFPHSGAYGPWLTTVDEVPDLAALELTTRLNGEVMQHASMGDLIFTVPTLIAYISQFARLMPGDVIATGTPGGVGGARKPPRWLKVGDTLEVSIPGVGTLSNTVAAEADVP